MRKDAEPSGETAARSWWPLAREPERLRRKGLSSQVEALMAEGVRIDVNEEGGLRGGGAVSADRRGSHIGILETDRTLTVLAMQLHEFLACC